MHARTDNVKTVYPPQTKFAGGININRLRVNILVDILVVICNFQLYIVQGCGNIKIIYLSRDK